MEGKLNIRINEFNAETESIEEWLDGFEAILDALEINKERKKIKLLKSKIGPVGEEILKGTGSKLTWEQAKEILRNSLEDKDAKAAALQKLIDYEAGEKPLGLVATEVLRLAHTAAYDEEDWQRLAVRFFLDVIPWEIAEEIRMDGVTSLSEALEEAQFLTERKGHNVEEPQEPFKVNVQQLRRALEEACGQEDPQEPFEVNVQQLRRAEEEECGQEDPQEPFEVNVQQPRRAEEDTPLAERDRLRLPDGISQVEEDYGVKDPPETFEENVQQARSAEEDVGPKKSRKKKKKEGKQSSSEAVCGTPTEEVPQTFIIQQSSSEAVCGTPTEEVPQTFIIQLSSGEEVCGTPQEEAPQTFIRQQDSSLCSTVGKSGIMDHSNMQSEKTCMLVRETSEKLQGLVSRMEKKLTDLLENKENSDALQRETNQELESKIYGVETRVTEALDTKFKGLIKESLSEFNVQLQKIIPEMVKDLIGQFKEKEEILLEKHRSITREEIQTEMKKFREEYEQEQKKKEKEDVKKKNLGTDRRSVRPSCHSVMLPRRPVAYDRVVLDTGRTKYVVKSMKDLDRLVRKERQPEDVMVTVKARRTDRPTRRGIELAKQFQGVLKGGVARENTWKELQELRGACSAKEEVKCYTGKESKKNERKQRKEDYSKKRQAAAECKQTVRNAGTRMKIEWAKRNENHALEPAWKGKMKNRFFQEKSLGKSLKFRRKTWSPAYIRRTGSEEGNSVPRIFLAAQATAPGLTQKKNREGPAALGTFESLFGEDIAQSRRTLLEYLKHSCMGGRTAIATDGEGTSPVIQ